MDVDHCADGPEDELNRVGTAGPRDAPDELIARLRAGTVGEEWRTKYEPGEDPEHQDRVHEGRILFADGDSSTAQDKAVFGPLWDLSQPDCGAVEIEYRRAGRWEAI